MEGDDYSRGADKDDIGESNAVDFYENKESSTDGQEEILESKIMDLDTNNESVEVNSDSRETKMIDNTILDETHSKYTPFGKIPRDIVKVPRDIGKIPRAIVKSPRDFHDDRQVEKEDAKNDDKDHSRDYTNGDVRDDVRNDDKYDAEDDGKDDGKDDVTDDVRDKEKNDDHDDVMDGDRDDYDIYLDIIKPQTICGTELKLLIEDIRYTRQFVACCFRHTDSERCVRLEEAVVQGIYNKRSLKKIPRLCVMQLDGRYWTVGGNKRLYVFRSLAKLGVIEEIVVEVVDFSPEWFRRCRSSVGDGTSVSVRPLGVRCAEQSFRSRYDVMLKRKRISYIYVSVSAVVVVALAVAVAVCISMFKTQIRQYACAVDDIMCSRSECVCHENECVCPACVCHCPGVSICGELPVLDYIALKWKQLLERWNRNQTLT